MTEAASSFEGLLREALAPVEPPAELAQRLEATLLSITEMAADELEAWELSRDARSAQLGAARRSGRRGRRRRHRPAAAARAAQSARALPRALAGMRDAAERALRDVSRETRRLIGER